MKREPTSDTVRRAIAVQGVVQGVGFRPYVDGLARRLGVGGAVRNGADGVRIEVEGARRLVDRFVGALEAEAPPLARVDEVRVTDVPTRGERTFRIDTTDRQGLVQAFVPPDVATCDDCLRELFDADDRRYGYPFSNCTRCGPRLTIVRSLPYDRERTTMAAFPMCEACRHEYDDPTDRRHHAQPTACPACGPQPFALDGRGRRVPVRAPVEWAVEELAAGAVLAIKGLGGYHLACDAGDRVAVKRLRERKRRGRKPFAVMVSDLEAAAATCVLSDEERRELAGAARPIVLARRRPGAPLADEVAPGLDEVGIMLPYTPLHHLLLRRIARPLVMTSGNRSDEPIAHRDADAIDRLAGVADGFLSHDRPIETRCDDSVVRVVAGSAMPIRRSRGHAPMPVPLPAPLPEPTLAVGAQMKSTFALGRGGDAVVSHHLGDLDYADALRAFREAIEHYERLYGIEPRIVAHDLHPGYAATRYALGRSRVEHVGVQHHHAHMAACLADNRLSGAAIGVCFDGTGYGTDGAIWGGEWLVGGAARVRRAAHLKYVAMPGGARAIRQPWRMALAHARARGVSLEDTRVAARATRDEREVVGRMIERGLHCPPTSSVGRLFDAVAALLGVCDEASFDGEPAMRLEALAARSPADEAYRFGLAGGSDGWEVDAGPAIGAIVADVRTGRSPERIARAFHEGIADVVVDVCRRIAREEGLDRVVLSGGVWINRILADGVVERLSNVGFRVYRHRRTPPGDGGISFGQLAVVAARAPGR